MIAIIEVDPWVFDGEPHLVLSAENAAERCYLRDLSGRLMTQDRKHECGQYDMVKIPLQYAPKGGEG